METIFASDRAESCLGSDDVNLDIFLDTATFENELDGSSKILTFVEFKKWCGLVPSVRKFLGSLLMPSGLGLFSSFKFHLLWTIKHL